MEQSICDDGDAKLWRLFLDWSQDIHATVNYALIPAADLSISEFELMARLWHQPTHQLPQRELTLDLGWSPSRASHLLRRLENHGLVERHHRNGLKEKNVRLTAEGLRHLENGLGAYRHKVRFSTLSLCSSVATPPGINHLG